jgi:IS30 family transposase
MEVLLRRGDGIRVIARILKRSPSTISRELKRNGDSLVKGAYWAAPAHDRTLVRRKHAKPQLRRIDNEPELKQRIREMFQEDLSPEQAAGRLAFEKKHKPVSYSSIYRFVYRDYLLGGDLWRKLRKPRWKRRRMQYLKNRPNQGQILNRVFIENRPKIIDARKRRGDFERDTVRGSAHEPVILTIVDRKSKLTRLAFLRKKTAKDTHEKTVALLGPDSHCHSITNDNGKEFAWHEKTASELGIPIYFSHPHCSWERGTNENTNGLLRQYFPKGSDFTQITEEQVIRVEQLLNHRPRKCLGYRTPLEVHLRP